MTARLILLITAVLYPLSGYFYEVHIPNIHNRMGIQLSIGAMLFFVFVMTFVNKGITRKIQLIMVIIYSIIVTDIEVSIYQNNLEPAYVIGLLLSQVISTVILRRYQSFLIFSAFVLAGAIVVALLVENPLYPSWLFILAIISAILLSFLLLLNRISMYKRLTFSDSLIHNINSIVIATDRHWNVIFVNQRVKKILGYDQEELLQRGWWKIRCKTPDEEAAEQRSIAGSSITREPYVSMMQTKDGEGRWFQWVNTRFRGGTIVGVGTDITEQKKQEDLVLKLSMIASQTDNYVMIMNSNDRIEWVNDGFTRTFGFSESEAIGKKPSELLAGVETRTENMEAIDQAVYVDNVPISIEMLHYRKDKSVIWLDKQITPLLNPDGSLRQYFVMGRDITERKEFERLLVEKNKSITDSINYARIIQQAYLPRLEPLKSVFDSWFLLFRPQAIVSGDFYWMQEREGLVYLAAADCIGHGVPGGLMSMMGINELNNVQKSKIPLTDPGEMLNLVHNAFSDSFNPAHSDQLMVHANMDIALIVYDPAKKELQFAGAQRPLYQITEGKLVKHQGQMMPIGEHYISEKNPFHSTTIKVKKGDCLYMFSDGFADQFNELDVKKFSMRKFNELLLTIHPLKMELQKRQLEEALDKWQGSGDQIDDIMVLGFRV